ncbi:Fe-S oxidoreductase [Nitrosotalea sinensis]|jgi:MoaA/NifB/PqqE/SkfB family radical SAM enzyme|uniref:Fe-S oxidoreductase n=1 Tax=Nitrosotalea sinensis TaxID=1499975 RepID=A0A2H1EGY1_9ARCH|nr:radical SAM protein [Candidatus Nitrosotalea sinensis]SHO45871.1 Fe-S oxidoreductase [Candidatus Nitrosotalea sinensis]
MEIMGRGFTQIIQEMPCYFHIFGKFAGYKLLNRKSPLYGSADIINVCNLHCTHCYWWLNRKENEELTVEQWQKVIDEKFKKNHVFIITLVGGEPTLRPDVIDLFVKQFPKRVCIVSNGTLPIRKIPNLYFYWISIDGTKEIHDKIRGPGSYDKTRKHVLEYVQNNGDKAWKDIWITMTINSQNYKTVKDVMEEWHDHTNKIGFQFHTPFAKGDPLFLPFGPERTRVVDDIMAMRKKFDDDYIINPDSQLELMKKNWGGRGTTPIDCPTWAIVSVDHMGREKRPCCIGSAENSAMKPICEECGLGCYSVLVGYGMKG